MQEAHIVGDCRLNLSRMYIRIVRRLSNLLVCGSSYLATTALVTLCLAGCIDTSTPSTLNAAQFCEEDAEITCQKTYSCFSAEEREPLRRFLLGEGKDIGSTEASCTANMKGLCVTKPFRCEPGNTFQEMKARLCADSLDRLTCDEWIKGGTPLVGCDKVCSLTVGGK
jgi:hypothetical protein